jgi:hypothetical protein
MTTEQRKAGKRERVRELLEKLRASKPDCECNRDISTF